MIWVTVGGVSVSIVILLWKLIDWWPGIPSLRKKPLPHLGRLGPFAACWCFGVLVPMVYGGLVFWAGWAGLWAMNWLGDAALVWGVGSEWQQSAQRAASIRLTAFGNASMLVLTFCVYFLARKRDGIWPGVLCGMGMGSSAGVAGLVAVPLSQGVDKLGLLVYGAFL